MIVSVKICGIKTEDALDAALEGGADYAGLVFYPKSPRHIDLATARHLRDRAHGRAEVVALTVDADDAALEAIMASVRPDMIQLHGSETPGRTREIAARFCHRLLKAIKVETADDVTSARAYASAARILFDAKPLASDCQALPGGNGVPFDWRLLRGIAEQMPFMLSGGLTPENVQEAIRLTGAAAVDVSSGVEIRPGEKSPELIRRFLLAAKAVKETA
jgi:phosphoribosylanthranilate isomerase